MKTSLFVLFAAAALLMGCPSSVPSGTCVTDASVPGTDSGLPDSGSDAGMADAGRPDAGLQWASVSLLERDAGYIIERVSYLSSGLNVFGQVCRPDDSVAHPVIVRNHGGFAGLAGDAQDAFCRNAAINGFVVANSSYRGEDGSDGHIEVCLGEVEDVRALMAVLKQQPYVQPNRFAAWGGSHGGCITLRLALEEPSLKAAVDDFGPTDLSQLVGFWYAEVGLGEPPPCPADGGYWCAFIHGNLIGVLSTATGGSPAQYPAQYTARSPIMQLANLTVPTMMLHGTADFFVDYLQSCAARDVLWDAGRTVASWFLDPNLNSQNSVAVCDGGFSLSPAPNVGAPGAYGQYPFYFLLYQDQGHGFSGAAGNHAFAAGMNFILSRL